MGGYRNSISRRQLLLGAGAAALTGACSRFKSGAAKAAGEGDLRGKALDAMRRAMAFMRESCAVNGGYVWSYAADFSRRWGEMEAYPTMIWIQPPGTATVGHLYLDCLHATRDAEYYAAAAEVADGLIAAQHPAGGWNYLHDFGGEESIRHWYDTIGENGWRLEEFHHYYGNATFDDAGTAEATQFLLRIYLEQREQRFEKPLRRALGFMIDSQYDNGGWPQRFPFVDDMPALHGHPDYTRLITFNDDVTGENIKTLLMAWQALGDERALAAVRRAMGVFALTQQAAPQAGWGLQHHLGDLSPAGARSYEPEALVTHTTANNVSLLLDFCQWTGDKRFLARIPEALDWLESVRLPAGDVRMPGREFPTFIEIGSNRAIYNHRRGSNVFNGEYYQDYSPEHPIGHYSQWRAIDVGALRKAHARLDAGSSATLQAASPLERREDFVLPAYFTARNIEVSDLNSDAGHAPFTVPDAAHVGALVAGLDAEGRWLTPLTATSHPYSGPGPETPVPGDYSETRVGDKSDTSPYLTDTPETGISTGRFIQNMSALMQYVAGDGIDKSHGNSTQGNSD